MNGWRWSFLMLAIFAFGLGDAVGSAQQVIAHRGASANAPENTLAAFRLAWEQGADGIEGDFYLTSDGQIVCLHDSDTGRTGDRRLPVGQSTLEELRTVDVGAWKGEKFRGERIPTLVEVLAVVPPGKKIFVEVKCGPQIVPQLKRDIAASKLAADQVAIISFHASVIEAARKEMPEIAAYWLSSLPPAKENQPPGLDLSGMIETLRVTGASGLDLQAERGRMTKANVDQLRAGGYELHCWTVNDEALAREYQALGVESITTDRPAVMRKLLSDRGTSSAAAAKP